MPISQYEAQSGHCILEEVSQSSKYSVLPMLLINSFDFSLNGLNSSVLFKSSVERVTVRERLELLNQSFDGFLAIRVFFLYDCVRYTWNSAINVSATGFPVLTSLTFFGMLATCVLEK